MVFTMAELPNTQADAVDELLREAELIVASAAFDDIIRSLLGVATDEIDLIPDAAPAGLYAEPKIARHKNRPWEQRLCGGERSPPRPTEERPTGRSSPVWAATTIV
ncbi:MAG: hypothetical protein JWQ43_1500 [Glaciihabitans sp.]|nr:hypothetical protein [Glaciihabitans sp.]